MALGGPCHDEGETEGEGRYEELTYLDVLGVSTTASLIDDDPSWAVTGTP